MIDGIKTGYLPLDVERLSTVLNVKLNQQKIYATQDGLKFGFIQAVDKSTGELRYMCGVAGSVHTFNNHGTHNADTFRLSDLEQVFNELKERYSIPAKSTPLYSVEFGVNLRLPYSPKRVLNAIKSYRGKTFTPLGELGLQYESDLYTLKFYDKGRKYREFEKDNILRIEIRAKCSYLRRKKLPVRFLLDLLDTELWERFEGLLIEAVQNTMIIEAVSTDSMNEKDKVLFELFTGDSWLGFDKFKLYREKKKFVQLVERYKLSQVKDELIDFIKVECIKLRDKQIDFRYRIKHFLDNSDSTEVNLSNKPNTDDTEHSATESNISKVDKKNHFRYQINIKIKGDLVANSPPLLTVSTLTQSHPPDTVENNQHNRIRGETVVNNSG